MSMKAIEQKKMPTKSIDFIAKFSRMGNERIAVLVPVEFHNEITEKKLMNKFLKFHAEEILESSKK